MNAASENALGSASLYLLLRWRLQLATAFVLLLLCMLLVGYHLGEVSAVSFIRPTCFAITIISVWVFWSWQHVGGSLFDPYGLFMLAAIAFNASQPILQAFGLNPIGVLAGQFSPETTLKSLFSVAMGIAATHLGALTAASRFKQYKMNYVSNATADVEANALYWIGWIMLCVSILPIVISLSKSLEVVYRSGYFGLYQQEAGVGIRSGIQILAGLFVPATLFIMGGSKKSGFSAPLSLVLISVYSIINLVLGARYGAFAPLLGYAWLWDKCRTRIPRKALILGAGIAIIVIFPLLQGLRDIPLSEKTPGDYQRALASFDTAVAGLREMGGSLATVAYTLDLVPVVRSYDYGLQYIYSIYTVIPNIFWEIHPTVKRSTPSVWLIWQVDPVQAARGGGLGFSFIAEAILNFGLWGAPIVLFLIGFGYARFVTWALCGHSVPRLAMAAVYMTYFMVYARSDSTSIIRPLFWYVLFPYLIVLVARRKRRVSV